MLTTCSALPYPATACLRSVPASVASRKHRPCTGAPDLVTTSARRCTMTRPHRCDRRHRSGRHPRGAIRVQRSEVSSGHGRPGRIVAGLGDRRFVGNGLAARDSVHASPKVRLRAAFFFRRTGSRTSNRTMARCSRAALRGPRPRDTVSTRSRAPASRRRACSR